MNPDQLIEMAGLGKFFKGKKERTIKLSPEQKAIASEYAKFALQFAAPIFIGPVPESGRGKINNGTVTLVNLGDRQYGVTNIWGQSKNSK